ncbi:translocation and assembly module lipoprotein TamL [Halocola ammonii]
MWLWFFAAVAISLSSCTGNKWLEEGERYYDGASVEYNKLDSVPERVKRNLESSVRPEPNQKIFFSRPKVWFYHVAGEVEKDKGFRHFVKTKLGEKPVLLSDVNIDQNEEILSGKAVNEGFFYATASHDTSLGKHSAELIYQLEVKYPYRVQKIHLPKRDSTTALQILDLALQETTLDTGEIYSLDKLVDERDRISGRMKEEGFFFFQPDYLLYQVDSTKGDHKVEIYFKLKETVPDWALQRYYLRNVQVNTNYSLEKDTTRSQADTTKVDKIAFISKKDQFKPKRILAAVKLDPGDLYDINKHDITLKQLSNLGIFQFVNIRFDRVANTDSLDVRVLLSPMKKKSIRTELLMTTKSNNFTGPEIGFQFRNRNTFGGAELLTIDLSAGYETQFGGGSDRQRLNSYSVTLTSRLYLPRYSGPIKFDKMSTRFAPRTFFELKYELLNRANFYSLNSFSGGFGYNWQETKIKSHDLRLININYIHLLDQSEEFQDLISTNALLRESFEDQLIFGTIYSYTHSNQGHVPEEKKTTHYFKGTLELAGNSLFAGYRAFSASDSRDYQIGGVPFSQYARAEIDYRLYWKLSRKMTFAMRRILAAGIPYQNSSTLPYSKQFFVGGANSIRAFLPRSVGPGTFDFTGGGDASAFLDQSGEMKIAGSFELRYSFNSIFKGAVFVDGGNVWLINEREEKPGGQFDIETFWGEFAVGTGAGLRIDASFILLRLDVGFPIRKPWIRTRAERWVVDEIQFGMPDWRRENLVWNVAIGYPF